MITETASSSEADWNRALVAMLKIREGVVAHEIQVIARIAKIGEVVPRARVLIYLRLNRN